MAGVVSMKQPTISSNTFTSSKNTTLLEQMLMMNSAARAGICSRVISRPNTPAQATMNMIIPEEAAADFTVSTKPLKLISR